MLTYEQERQLNILVAVLLEKAEHIAENWQDSSLISLYSDIIKILDKSLQNFIEIDLLQFSDTEKYLDKFGVKKYLNHYIRVSETPLRDEPRPHSHFDSIIADVLAMIDDHGLYV